MDPEACNPFVTWDHVAFDDESFDGYEGGNSSSEKDDEVEEKDAEQQVRHANHVHRAIARANTAALRTWRYERYALGNFCDPLHRMQEGDLCLFEAAKTMIANCDLL